MNEKKRSAFNRTSEENGNCEGFLNAFKTQKCNNVFVRIQHGFNLVFVPQGERKKQWQVFVSTLLNSFLFFFITKWVLDIVCQFLP